MMTECLQEVIRDKETEKPGLKQQVEATSTCFPPFRHAFQKHLLVWFNDITHTLQRSVMLPVSNQRGYFIHMQGNLRQLLLRTHIMTRLSSVLFFARAHIKLWFVKHADAPVTPQRCFQANPFVVLKTDRSRLDFDTWEIIFARSSSSRSGHFLFNSVVEIAVSLWGRWRDILC